MADTGRALALVLILAHLAWFRVGGQQNASREDGDALEAFLTDVLGSSSSNYTADRSPCDWNKGRVNCTANGRISHIDFSGFQLAGNISSNTLSNLSELVALNLSGNALTGLPTDLGRLTKLQTLLLSENALAGLPTDLGLLQNLDTLVLSRNRLVGAYPGSIANLTKLQHLNLSGNTFDGSILEVVVGLSQLETLDLSENRFSGNLSGLLEGGQLTGLNFIDLSFNRFEGSIPDGICKTPAFLETLRLGSNRLSGVISSITCNSLKRLNLSSNGMDGSLPTDLTQVAHLEELDLSGNSFDGEVPSSVFSQLSSLRVLDLHSNNLTGSLQFKDGEGKNLEEVDLESNRLDGPIPVALLQLSKLKTLKLGNNSFSGSVPVATLPALVEVDLHSNNLSGVLPGLNGGLLKLDFSSNSFTGGLSSIPQGLQVLDMHNNRLNGSLPALSDTDSLKYLDLSSNLFTGDFPPDFSRLTNLTVLVLADNNFYSHSFPVLGILPELEVLNFSRTNLNGEIPAAIGNLTGLQHLDLSGNNLTGEIPTEMSTLTKLVTLDLSDNGLQGTIPPDLGKLPLISLDLSNNNLSGTIPDQWRNFTDTSFLNNPGLCGDQVNRICDSEVRSRRDNFTHKRMALIIGLVVGVSVLLIVALSLFLWCRVFTGMAVKPLFKDDSTARHVSGPMFLEKDPESWATGIKDPHSIPVVMFEKPLLNLTFADLMHATANFSKEHQIADGGYGPVYKGALKDDTQLAIKVLVEVKFTDGKDAMARIEALANVKHANLVALVGYCLVSDDSLLIFEYMINGDLHRWLHELPEGTRNPEDWSEDTWEHMEGDEMSSDFLSWSTRHKIALGTARALAFLHHGCSPPIVHRDVKASNILLDESFEAHLVDCGLAGIADPTTAPPVIIGGGTVGYVPPEYGQTPEDYTPRGDVYSFGVVLLELVTGRKPTGHYSNDSYGGNLVGWVRLAIKDKRGEKAVDRKLVRHGDVNQILEVLQIGYLCTAESPAKRPTMQQVVGLLKDCQPGP